LCPEPRQHGWKLCNEPDAYAQHDALGLADLIRRGEVSAAEVCETAIASVEALNPALNAVVARALTEWRGSVGRPLRAGMGNLAAKAGSYRHVSQLLCVDGQSILSYA
jgi:hypothetical protein